MLRYLDRTTGELIEYELVTENTYDWQKANAQGGLVCNDPSLAQQNMKEETDINTIVDRFLKTGTAPLVPMPPSIEEFGEVFDFTTAMGLINQANHAFMQLPADTRRRFGHDPQEFVAFVDEQLQKGEEGLEELRRMNLAIPKQTPPPAPEPTLVRVVKDPETPSKGS